MVNGRENIKGLTQTELRNFASQLGEQSFRGDQLFHWLYRHGVTTFDEMTTIGKPLREKLYSVASLEQCQLVSLRTSNDGTLKFLFQLSDESRIESVLIPSQTFEPNDDAYEHSTSRLTLCVSTQVGCPLDCQFCATGTMGFKQIGRAHV